VLPRVNQHVRTDLGEGRLEQDEVAIVGAPAHALAEQVDGMVKRVETVFQSGERGVEFKGFWVDGAVGLRNQ
jgi:hypothetical protein